ncbi:MAG: VWA domain-containing protein [Planctomycetota bacterium]
MIALEDFEILRPEAFWFAAAAVLVLFLVVRALRRRREALARLRPKGGSDDLGWRRGASIARGAFAVVAIALASAALAGPVVGSVERPVVAHGIDVVICLDTSRSMLARDVKPSRFERAKREISLLLSELDENRASLVAFGGDAERIAPLTRDRVALRGFLDTVDVASTRVGGTDLGAAVDYALGMFEDRSGRHEAIVLVTDGEDLTGEGLAAAERAEEKGIRVYVVGVGTRQGAKIPVADPSGDEHFLVGPDGKEVVTRLVADSLERMAIATGGAYSDTERSARPLIDLYRGPVSSVQQREVEEGTTRVPFDRYQWPLLLAVLLVTIESGVAEVRRARRAGPA